MVRPCFKFVHFDEVYRAPDKMYLSNRQPDKRLCVTCGFLRRDHQEGPDRQEQLAEREMVQAQMPVVNEDGGQ